MREAHLQDPRTFSRILCPKCNHRLMPDGAKKYILFVCENCSEFDCLGYTAWLTLEGNLFSETLLINNVLIQNNYEKVSTNLYSDDKEDVGCFITSASTHEVIVRLKKPIMWNLDDIPSVQISIAPFLIFQ